MKMKNKYEIGQNYILNLENEQLRERIKELAIQLNELKKKYEEREKRKGVVQNEREDAVIQG
jgi:regulator of replication initiation timing